MILRPRHLERRVLMDDTRSPYYADMIVLRTPHEMIEWLDKEENKDLTNTFIQFDHNLGTGYFMSGEDIAGHMIVTREPEEMPRLVYVESLDPAGVEAICDLFIAVGYDIRRAPNWSSARLFRPGELEKNED